MAKATPQDAELILRIYELRREKVLRAARAWFASEFRADSAAQLAKKHPANSREDAYFRMVVSYWDMVGALVKHKTVNEDLFFETNREYLGVWNRARPVIEDLRRSRNNPRLYANLEQLNTKYQEWVAKQERSEFGPGGGSGGGPEISG